MACREDWIDGFMAYTENTTSPLLYRKWAAISCVAGALERKVWVRTMGSETFPNLYVILVGPPGVGKSEVTWRVNDFWNGLEHHHVAPTSVTKASLIDTLNDADRRIIVPPRLTKQKGAVDNFNSLLLCINELGTLIPAYENEFMNVLTDLWDCKNYSEKRRTSKIEIDIPKTQLNLIAACTPSYLNGTLPEGAWDQGFISRTLLIYSGDSQKRSLFAEDQSDEQQRRTLQKQLDHIGDEKVFYGNYKFSPTAAELIDAFWMSGGDPKPEHPKLIYYTTRRTRHLLKLCIIAAASRKDELVIDEQDFHRALDWLLEAELYMPEIFKAMTQGGTGQIMEDAWYFVYQLYMKSQKPVYKHQIIQYLKDKVPAHNIMPTLEMMEASNMIKKQFTPAGDAYTPVDKTSF